MQAITTKYLCPTNSRGSRLIAKCAAGSVQIVYDDALNIDGNHVAAARALLDKLGWSARGYTVHTGCMHTGDYCHVLTK